MLEALKEAVLLENLRIASAGLAPFTWGNVSALDATRTWMVIKPSGVAYTAMGAEDMVVVSLETGETAEGSLLPSSDTPTHLALYRSFPRVFGVVHTHSPWAAVWAQAGREIPPLGTTHGDYFHGAVPCTREMTREEIRGDYEYQTGMVIAETFREKSYGEIPGVLVRNHGPFTWGDSCQSAVDHALYLEFVAKLALFTELLEGKPMSQALLDRHYLRKHGETAYYGQKEGRPC